MQNHRGKLVFQRTSSLRLLNQVVRGRAYSAKRIHNVGQPTAATHPHLLKEGEITPGITSEEYISRSKKLLELLPEKSLAILAAAPVKMNNDVVPYNFRQDVDYLYVTGFQQPGGVAVLGHDFGLCMFMPEPSPHEVTWQGEIVGVDAALDTFKAEISYPVSQLHEILPNRIKNSSKEFHSVYTAVPMYMSLQAFQNLSLRAKVKYLSMYTHEACLVKSPAELKLMRDAASIGCQALLQTMIYSNTFPYENMLSAQVEYECRMRSAQRMAFNPVVGVDLMVKDGDLVLMDIGCEMHGYASDLTRTWPPCGSFSDVQVELYDLILETNKECVKLCKPGTCLRDIHNFSVDKLRKGLQEIGLLKNDRDNHYLGMDVHNCSTITYDRILKLGVISRHWNED